MSEKGMIRSDIGPEVLIRSIMGNIAMLVAQRKLFGNMFKIEDFDLEIDKMIDVLLYGISKEGNDRV
jgi:hypothetical protein